MNELPIQEQEASNTVACFANKLVIGATIAAGAFMGARAANHFAPPNVELAPGINVQASLSAEPGATATLSPLIELRLPNAPVHIPGPLYEGVRLDPTKIDPERDSDTLGNYIALFSDYDTSIVQPIKEALVQRLAEGAGIGALATTLGYVAVAKSLQWRRENIQLRAELARRDSAENDSSDPNSNGIDSVIEKQKKHRSNWLRRPLAALALSGAILAGCASAGTVYGEVKQITTQETQTSALLPEEVMELDPALEDGSISGPLRNFPRTGIDIVIEKKKSIDHSLHKRANNFAAANRTFISENAEYRALRANPKIKSILHYSDFHCNRAFAEIVYGRLIEEIDPDIIVNTGDQQIARGSLPIEKDCFKMLTSRNGLIPTLYAGGNHDGDSDSSVIDVGKRGIVNEQGINFVAVKDPEKTEFTATSENEQDDLNKEIAKQGDKLADLARKVTEENDGIRPIALAHRWQLLARATLEGYIIIGNYGHRHSEGDVQQYKSDKGTTVLSHEAASLIGAKESFTYYSDLIQDATCLEELYDTETNQFAGFVLRRLIKETYETEVVFIPPPTTVQEPIAMQKFQEENGSK